MKAKPKQKQIKRYEIDEEMTESTRKLVHATMNWFKDMGPRLAESTQEPFRATIGMMSQIVHLGVPKIPEIEYRNSRVELGPSLSKTKEA